MFSFRPIGRDFGDKVPPAPTSPDSGDGCSTATHLPPDDIPDFKPADLARAISLSLAACGLAMSDDPVLSGSPVGTNQHATDQNNGVDHATAPMGWYSAPASDQTRYSLRPASSMKKTERAQYSLRRK